MIFIGILVTLISSAGAEEISDCDYFDTVDLTFSQRFDNGSYEYAGVLIPPDQTGTYNYKIVFRGTRSSVAEHVRGCVCKFKPCIRYFCHRHRYDLSDESKCVKELSSYVVPITLSNGTEIYTEVFDQFVVQPGIRSKCDDILYVNIFCDDSCKLFENGTMFISEPVEYLTKWGYSLHPNETVSNGLNYGLWGYKCIHYHGVTFVVLTSFVFLLLTILIHIIVVRVKHIHDKCFLCYLLCILADFSLSFVIYSETFLFGASCYIVAYLAFFFKMAVYLWLTVLAFDLWRKFVSHRFEVGDNDAKRRFLHYNLFSWGTAAVLLLITIIMDSMLDNLDISVHLKIGYAYYDCSAKMSDLSYAIYFLAPISVLVVCNTLMIIWTARDIYAESRRTNEQLERLGAQNVRNTRMRFVIFLRFFTIALMDWLLDLCGTLYNQKRAYSPFLYYSIIYYGNARSTLLLAVTLCRTDVRHLLKLWWHSR